MSIGEQFKGLDMKNLIGGPLAAAAESNLILASTTANFINEVGFDSNQNTRTVLFKYTKKEPTEEGTLLNQEMSVDVPLLAIVPIPNLQIDEVNIMFDMEVKQCERSESSVGVSASTNVTAGWRPVKVSISGSVSSHNTNTRSSDNSAKYHVDVRATNHGMPEGLARVLDMMAAAVSPNLIGSRPTDPSGNELTGGRKDRSMKLKELREKSLQLEKAENAARDTKDIKLKQFSQRVQILQNDAKRKFSDDMAKKTDSEKEEINEAHMDNFWNELQLGAGSKIALASSSYKEEDTIASFFPPEKKYEDYTNTNPANGEFKEAVRAHIEWEKRQKSVDENKTEYNNVMMNVGS